MQKKKTRYAQSTTHEVKVKVKPSTFQTATKGTFKNTRGIGFEENTNKTKCLSVVVANAKLPHR